MKAAGGHSISTPWKSGVLPSAGCPGCRQWHVPCLTGTWPDPSWHGVDGGTRSPGSGLCGWASCRQCRPSYHPPSSEEGYPGNGSIPSSSTLIVCWMECRTLLRWSRSPSVPFQQLCDSAGWEGGPVIQGPERMTCTASSTGTLVIREDTIKLTSTSSSSTLKFLITSTKCLEFLTYESVLPASGDIRDAQCAWRVGRKETLCTRQWVWVGPQVCGAWGDHRSWVLAACWPKLMVQIPCHLTIPFFNSFNLRLSLLSWAAVGSFPSCGRRRSPTCPSFWCCSLPFSSPRWHYPCQPAGSPHPRDPSAPSLSSSAPSSGCHWVAWHVSGSHRSVHVGPPRLPALFTLLLPPLKICGGSCITLSCASSVRVSALSSEGHLHSTHEDTNEVFILMTSVALWRRTWQKDSWSNLNCVRPSIQLTVDVEKDWMLPFLYTFLCRREDRR